MKVHSLINALAIWVSGFSFTASAVQPDITHFTLDNTQESCTVHFQGETIPLKLEPPCRLVKSADQTVQHHEYIGLGQVFIATGKPASSDYLKRWGSNTDSNCSDTAQHIIVGIKLKTGKSLMKGGLFCPDRGLDEIFFKDVYERLN